jgi:hypothetical protein
VNAKKALEPDAGSFSFWQGENSDLDFPGYFMVEIDALPRVKV